LKYIAVPAVIVAVLCACLTRETQAQQQPNTNALYHQLRGLLPGPTTITADNLVLKRDAATFTFTRGEFALFGEVNGHITGAVFGGQGHFHLSPPTATERHSLEILTKRPEYDEDFTQVVLRFTDSTADELRKAGTAIPAKSDSTLTQQAMEFHIFQREHLHENVDLRLLEDVLSPVAVKDAKAGDNRTGDVTQGGFFLASIKGVSNPHLLFEIDPRGARRVAPEEVRLAVWSASEGEWIYPSAFHLTGEYASGAASGRQENAAFDVDREELDTTIEKNGFLGGFATVHVRALEDGLVVVPFHLFPTLRVSGVEGEHGEVLDFVQERKEDDPDFGLVLATPLKKGQTTAVKITYGGKDAVRNVGNDNYDPVARESWFPNGGTGFGGYTTYHMVFHTAKDLQLIATGTKVHDDVDGRIRRTEWDSQMPLPVAGFHLGRFAEKEDKTPGGIAVSALANQQLPDWANGGYPTTTMLPVELSEGTVAAQIYETYFGKLPFDHLALSQQPACNYGQSWPMLVYLPICGFWDSTIQHQMGLRPDDPYWKTVTAHEVAHQWWGHTVGFKSYRDQWMSEGFADASAAIFLQSTRKSTSDYKDFWKQLKEQITQKNADGFRPIDVGPVTMGFRLSSPKTGWSVYQNLVYPKGAYILHMIRMMMWSSKTGDEDFMAMMHDFTATYRLKVATTEDFKAMVEKHMTPGMDLDKNHRMDWFFNEYVYGTDLPRYHFESSVATDGDKINLHFKLVQSGVTDTFKMLVPVYLEMSDGRSVLLGRVSILGNSTMEKTIPLAKPTVPIKHVSIDSMHDLLAIDN
jgi:hypothetical protein